MKNALPFLLVALLSTPLAGQEPTPERPPAQDPISMEDVLAAIDKLRQTFDLADLRVREAVEIPAPVPADRERSLTAASEALNLLVQDMEALLAILPEPEDQPNNPSSGSGKPSGQPKPKPGADQPQSGEKPDGSQTNGQTEQDRGKAPPPTGPPLFGQPTANYGRWGVLPPRLQEALQNSAGTEVPARYRRWLEEYHRRGQQPR